MTNEYEDVLPPLDPGANSHASVFGRPANDESFYELVAARVAVHSGRGVKAILSALVADVERGLIPAAGRTENSAKRWIRACREREYLLPSSGGRKYAPGPRLTQEAIDRADALDGGNA
jgi:hypothetical protein